ncbi:hypothetical protein BXY75_0018 [Ulvibacter antarcticus]|uniref:Uncharacterized protein n=2 Tax=Ulvibacter antarcticus TaxID=442714 RepID=A0A3L9ZB83_9FLAO|nr:hypothetical protein BXY75_0018 [Ulvibacter antarcticus]
MIAVAASSRTLRQTPRFIYKPVTTHFFTNLMKKLIIISLNVVLLIFLQSCATFNENFNNQIKLNELNLSELDGRYEIVPSESQMILKNSKKEVKNYSDFYSKINKVTIENNITIDSLKKYYFQLSTMSDKTIKISYFENNQIIKEQVLPTKLKNDGYLYVRTNKQNIRGVPFIVGGIDIVKSRMTLDNDQNLIFDQSEYSGGALFLIIFKGSSNYNYRYKFKEVH